MATPVLPNFTSLPNEIIADILDTDDLSERDLATCCLVSKTFLHLARRALYSELDVDATVGSDHSSSRLYFIFIIRTEMVKGLVNVSEHP
ncbi:hypothetical protein MNV49_001554 [Pseudohyphozyma bogoriensis]|nr:hypothetical protein MNV49_001554 [Pseudohyphozyma bogoriensis]